MASPLMKVNPIIEAVTIDVKGLRRKIWSLRYDRLKI